MTVMTKSSIIIFSLLVVCTAAFVPSSTTSWDRGTQSRVRPFQHRILFVSRQQQEQQLIEQNEMKKTNKDMQFPLEYNNNLVMKKTVSKSPPSSSSPSSVGAEGGNLLWRGVVVILCAVWASNFAAIKLVVAEPGVDSSLYAVARFGLATAALIPFALSKVRVGNDEPATTTTTTTTSEKVSVSSLPTSTGMDEETLKGAIICGSWVAFGYIGQLLGLITTTASKSCVICSLHCVFVAAVAELWRTRETNKSYDVRVLAPAALAVMGVSIVELWGASNGANIGDLLSFAQPIGFGMGYLQLENLMAKRPDLALPVSAIKLAMVTLASLFYFEIGPLLSHGAAEWTLRVPDFGPILSSPTALGGVFYTGLVTTALALWAESIAFTRVAATDASLILTTEPLFAAAFGAMALGETFGGSDYLGATFIIGACVLATLMEDSGEECITLDEPIDSDEDFCEPKKRWPFWGF